MSASRRVFAALKDGTRAAGMSTGSPVRGLRPWRAARVLADPVGGDGWESDRLRLVERLMPHVHRAVLIRQALAAADALGSGLAGLLDTHIVENAQ